jgi:hypothetical protein
MQESTMSNSPSAKGSAWLSGSCHRTASSLLTKAAREEPVEAL